jgi:hypothetical protein
MIDNSFAENIMNEIFEEPEATSVVVQEGLIKRIREILSKKRKQKETSDIAKKPDKKKDSDDKKSGNPVLDNKTPYRRKEVSGKSYFDRFYKNNDFCIECAPKDPRLPQMLANILEIGYEINTPVEVYYVSCADINEYYDLAGDNRYDDNCIFVVIPLDTLKDGSDCAPAKADLRARYFNDVVDNNEYREYIAGRHERSDSIEWIIKIKGER